MITGRCRASLLRIGAAFAGLIAWNGWLPAIALSVFMPIAVSLQKARKHAFLTALAYYTAASWPLVPGAKAFFGTNATWLESAMLWLISSFLLAFPFGIFWTQNSRLRPPGVFSALLIISVPPLGLIAWASPLTAAGVLFPGTAWLGLAMTLALCSLSCSFPRFMAATAGFVLLIAQATYHQPAPPASWQAIDTKFGSGFSASDPLREFETAEAIQRIIRDSDRKVIIFPEMVIRRWNDAVEAFWEPTLTNLRQADKTILLGAGLSVPGQSRSYLNAVVILGSHPSRPFIQRIPVPIAMWKPFNTKDSIPLRLLGAGTTIVAGQRAAILICYEQLLPWPILASAFENPDILIGIANNYWAKGTPIPVIQNSCLHAWAWLFRLPWLASTNS